VVRWQLNSILMLRQTSILLKFNKQTAASSAAGCVPYPVPKKTALTCKDLLQNRKHAPAPLQLYHNPLGSTKALLHIIRPT
jgi:hypothetical protein